VKSLLEHTQPGAFGLWEFTYTDRSPDHQLELANLLNRLISLEHGALKSAMTERQRAAMTEMVTKLTRAFHTWADFKHHTDVVSEASTTTASVGNTKFSRINTEMAKREPRKLFAPQDHENYAPALEAARKAIESGDRSKKDEAGGRPIPISRTPVVLRAIIEGEGKQQSKPFRRSEYVVGQGSSLYMKAENIHSGTEHDGKGALRHSAQPAFTDCKPAGGVQERRE